MSPAPTRTGSPVPGGTGAGSGTGGGGGGGGGDPASPGRRASSTPMVGPALVAVAVRGPVSPAATGGPSDIATRPSAALPFFREAAFHRAVIPGGGRSLPSALMAPTWTGTLPAVDVTTPGANSSVLGAPFGKALWPSTGFEVSTPA